MECMGMMEHTWPDVIKGTTSTRHFGKYKMVGVLSSMVLLHGEMN